MFLHFCNFGSIASHEEAVSEYSDQTKVWLVVFFPSKIKIFNYWSAARIVRVSSFMSYNFFFCKEEDFCTSEALLQSILEKQYQIKNKTKTHALFCSIY